MATRPPTESTKSKKTAAVILVNDKMCSSLHYSMLGTYFRRLTACWNEEYDPFLMMFDYIHVTNIQNGHHFHQQLAKMTHNLIDICYIDMFYLFILLGFVNQENTEQFPMMHTYKNQLIVKMAVILAEDFVYSPNFQLAGKKAIHSCTKDSKAS